MMEFEEGVKKMLVTGSIIAMLAVVIGAFGAHALKTRFEGTNYGETWETAVKYQMYHALGLILIGILQFDTLLGTQSIFSTASWLMVIGIILFSGSLYVLALTGIKKLGAITPLGGLCLIAAWLCVAIGVA